MSGRIISGTREISREQLVVNAARAATALHGLGIGEGDAVAVMLRNDIPSFEVLFAAAILGAYTVPINWHYRAGEAGYILRDSAAKVFVVHSDLLPQLEGAIPQGLPVLTVATPPEIQEAYGIAPELTRIPDDGTVWDEWVGGHTPWSTPPATSRGSMLYTSGSTGRPKGVRRQAPTEAQVESIGRMVGEIARISPHMRTVITGPLYHAMTNTYGLFAAREGELVVLQPRFDAEQLLSLIERHRITHLYLVPVMFVRLLKLPDETRLRYDLSSLEWVFHTAAPCPPGIKRAMIDWWGPVIGETYAGTEIGLITLCTSEEWLERPGTVGRCIDGAEVCIRDDDGRELPPGDVGLIYARNHNLPDFTYHGLDEKRREIERGGLITLGDMGTVDPEGYLYLRDRKADMVISGGVNIYPAEIEGVLIGHAAVRDCAVFGIPDDEFGESLAAIIQIQDGAQVTAEELQAHVRENLANYKVPKLVEFRSELPREDSGKIFKRRLRDPFWKDAGRSI